MSFRKQTKSFFTTFGGIGAGILLWTSIISAPPFWQVLKSKEADIVVAPLECDISEYCFMVSNVGNRPAVLTDIHGYNKETPNSMSIFPNAYKNKVIKPNEVFIIKASIKAGAPSMLPYELHKDYNGNDLSKNCKMRINFIQYYAEEDHTDIEFVCFDKSYLSKRDK